MVVNKKQVSKIKQHVKKKQNKMRLASLYRRVNTKNPNLLFEFSLIYIYVKYL